MNHSPPIGSVSHRHPAPRHARLHLQPTRNTPSLKDMDSPLLSDVGDNLNPIFTTYPSRVAWANNVPSFSVDELSSEDKASFSNPLHRSRKACCKLWVCDVVLMESP